jgi:MoaA/NifB/PqqE/SkfB family radical SAM enzyme
MKAEIGAFQKDRQELHKILPLETPLLLELHNTHICNFRCEFCIHSGPDTAIVAGKPFRREKMAWELFELMVEQCKAFPDKIKMCSIAGIGEPLTNSDIVRQVGLLKESGAFRKIQIITNATLLTHDLGEALVAAGLDELKVSLQGLSDKTYARVTDTATTFDKICQNVATFSGIKGSCKLSIKIGDSMLDGDGDEQKFYRLFGDICDAVGVEHIYDMWKSNGIGVKAAVEAKKSQFGYDNREIRVCRYRFTTFDIMPDGTFCLGGCHRRFGFETNIREVPIVEQWNSAGANKARRDKLMYGRDRDGICAVCEVSQQNWHPADLLEGHEEEILARMSERGMIEV